MVAALEDPQNREHDNVRVAIVRALGQIRDLSAGPRSNAHLRDPDKQVVKRLFCRIGLVGHTPARPAARTNVQDRSRPHGQEQLAGIPGAAPRSRKHSAVRIVVGQQRGLPAGARSRGIGAAQSTMPTAGRRAFSRKQKPNVRNALAFGLATSGEINYINDLANGLDTARRIRLRSTFMNLGSSKAKSANLYPYLRSTNPRVRAGMARVIGNIGDPASSDLVRPLTDDPDTEVVREAVAALRKMSR